jgi:hypothetical protein
MDKLYYTQIEVFGFHGCRKSTKNDLLDGAKFSPSKNKWDWLGDGIYFWENDYSRAREWADNKFGNEGAVIGVRINLSNCFDLTNSFARQFLKIAYADFHAYCQAAKTPLPKNSNPKNFSGNLNDLVLRYLDRAVIHHLFSILTENDSMQYDSIRASFQEGSELFPGSAFRTMDHIQICVRNDDRIIEIFDPEIRNSIQN